MGDLVPYLAFDALLLIGAYLNCRDAYRGEWYLSTVMLFLMALFGAMLTWRAPGDIAIVLALLTFGIGCLVLPHWRDHDHRVVNARVAMIASVLIVIGRHVWTG